MYFGYQPREMSFKYGFKRFYLSVGIGTIGFRFFGSACGATIEQIWKISFWRYVVKHFYYGVMDEWRRYEKRKA